MFYLGPQDSWPVEYIDKVGGVQPLVKMDELGRVSFRTPPFMVLAVWGNCLGRDGLYLVHEEGTLAHMIEKTPSDQLAMRFVHRDVFASPPE